MSRKRAGLDLQLFDEGVDRKRQPTAGKDADVVCRLLERVLYNRNAHENLPVQLSADGQARKECHAAAIPSEPFQGLDRVGDKCRRHKKLPSTQGSIDQATNSEISLRNPGGEGDNVREFNAG